MGRVFNQFLHAGERTDDKVIVANLGSYYDKEKQKQLFRGGYLVICKCGYGYLTRTSGTGGNVAKGYSKYLCPYCERKLKEGE